MVAHRGFWNLPWEGTAWTNGPLDFEDLAEATCAWEHRLDSHWVILCVLRVRSKSRGGGAARPAA